MIVLKFLLIDQLLLTLARWSGKTKCSVSLRSVIPYLFDQFFKRKTSLSVVNRLLQYTNIVDKYRNFKNIDIRFFEYRKYQNIAEVSLNFIELSYDEVNKSHDKFSTKITTTGLHTSARLLSHKHHAIA